MSRPPFAPLLLVLTACASLDGAEPPARQGATPTHGTAVEAGTGQPWGSSALEQRPGDAPELELWSDPSFRRRLAESYLAETEVEPRLTTADRERLQRAFDRLAAGDLDGAERLLLEARGEEESAVFDVTLGNVLSQREDLERAVAAYRAAVEKFPRFRRAWRSLGLIHVRRGELAEAARALTRVIELGGGDALTYGLLGSAHAGLGSQLAAESAFRMAALLEPDALDWKLGLARSFVQQERFAEAASLCGDLIEAQPERAELWLLQGGAFLGLGQPLRAAEAYELADRLGGATAASLAMLGDIYVNEGLFDLATAAHLRALDEDPQAGLQRPLRAAAVLTARGALGETRRLIEGIETLGGERLGDAERRELLGLRARLAVAEGDGDEEARVLEEIVRLDPLDGEALILLGRHAGRTGDPERAAFWLERAASLEAFEADAKLRHGQLLVQQGSYAEALPLLRRAQALEPRESVREYIEEVERVAGRTARQ